MNNWFKQNGIHLAIIGIFLAICFFYFTPAFQGKVLSQGDVTRAQATQTEIMQYRAKDTTILWTNSMFGGMPTFQIWMSYPYNVTTYVINIVKTVFPNPIDTVMILLLGTYMLFCVLKLNPWLAAAGAIAFAFSSYNIILIDAGHANQAFAIAFFAPVLAGIILALRGKYLLGAAITAFFLSMEIRANHLQMTYYLMFAIVILIGIELFHAIKAKNTKPFFTSISYLAIGTLLALAVNASMLWTTFEYGKETNRGQSHLTQHTTEPSNGLSKDYAYAWSQGVGESFTFLVPNLYGGGSSTMVSEDSKVAKVLVDKGLDANQSMQFAQQLPLYWGEKPFTEGPIYFGAVICFLFVFGLIVVKSRIKWWLLGVIVLTMFLSFGKNLPFLSDIFFKYVPLYNKFRAVESILAVAELCFPILALLAVNEIIVAKDRASILKKLLLAFYITGGVTLILAVAPDLFFSFKTSNHAAMVEQLTQAFRGDGALANSVAAAMIQDRISLAHADAWRSLLFIVVTFGILFAFVKDKVNVTVLSIVILALTLGDMWGVDKRYLKDDHFVPKDDVRAPVPGDVDRIIMQDKDPDYRVFDMKTGDPFTDASTSAFHKSIGGYHAAKLKRYDELQSSQFSKSVNQDVLDMLNTKYIITTDPKTQSLSMHRNESACGHAWFVKNVKYAQTADEEMQAISGFDPRNEAIVDQQYSKLIDEKQNALDTNGTIDLVSYSPDHLVYKSGTTTPQIAVFSEVYYDKGWKMYIDDVEKPYFRADYLLRAAQIPTGNHTIRFDFHPTSYYAGEKISLAGSVLMVLLLGGALYMDNKKKPVTAAATPKR